MMRMVVMLVTVGIVSRLPVTAGMFLRTVIVVVAGVVVVLIFAAAAIRRCAGRFSLRSTTTTAVRSIRCVLRQKLLPAMFAAKVKGPAIAFSL